MQKENLLAEFEKKINYSFKDKKLLIQAFTHRSFINEHQKSGLSHNERLEFLGDAVLELIVTDFLYRQYPSKTEGELTAKRAALVNANTLAKISQESTLGELLLLSKGESKDIGRARQTILADAFEALIGAIYLDAGYIQAEKFINEFLLKRSEEIIKSGILKDSKSRIQEKAQEIFAVTPSYKIVKEIGPDHDKQFTVAIFFGTEKIALGNGKSKQEAEQNAAQKALEERSWN
jgi:ribonuclease III